MECRLGGDQREMEDEYERWKGCRWEGRGSIRGEKAGKESPERAVSQPDGL